VVWGGVTAYANEVKEQILGVPGELLARHGAVSEEVAASMARGVLALANGTASGGIRGVGAQSSGSAPADEGPGGDGTAGIGVVDLGIAVTGVAGPGGGTPEKPVGTVWIAAARREGETTTRLLSLPASRDRVRRWTAISAMLLAYEVMTVDMPPRG
jgi:nicotinamide mononucleotide (NMN) deamidase PncC